MKVKYHLNEGTNITALIYRLESVENVPVEGRFIRNTIVLDPNGYIYNKIIKVLHLVNAVKEIELLKEE